MNDIDRAISKNRDGDANPASSRGGLKEQDHSSRGITRVKKYERSGDGSDAEGENDDADDDEGETQYFYRVSVSIRCSTFSA